MRRLAAALTAVLLTAACGVEPSAEEVVAAVPAAVEQRAAVQARMQVDTVPGGTMVVEGVTALDNSAGDWLVTTEAQGEQLRLPMRLVDGIYYYGTPDHDRWYAVSADRIADLTGIDASASSVQSTGLIAKLSDLSSTVTEIRTERIDGATTTHYRFEMSTELLIADGTSSGTFSAEHAELVAELYPDSVDVDLWIDDDTNLPRRVQWKIDLDLSSVGEADTTTTVRIDYLRWTDTVDIEAPPEDQVQYPGTDES